MSFIGHFNTQELWNLLETQKMGGWGSSDSLTMRSSGIMWCVWFRISTRVAAYRVLGYCLNVVYAPPALRFLGTFYPAQEVVGLVRSDHDSLEHGFTRHFVPTAYYHHYYPYYHNENKYRYRWKETISRMLLKILRWKRATFDNEKSYGKKSEFQEPCSRATNTFWWLKPDLSRSLASLLWFVTSQKFSLLHKKELRLLLQTCSCYSMEWLMYRHSRRIFSWFTLKYLEPKDNMKKPRMW